MAILRFPVELSGWSGGPGVNVFHARVDDSNPSGIAQVLAGHLGFFYSQMGSFIATGVQATLGQVTDVETREGVDAGTGWTYTMGGGNPLPHATSIVIGWRTAVMARRGMGRTFLGPSPVGVLQDNGTINDIMLGNLRNYCTGLIEDSNATSGGAFGVYGYQNAVPAGLQRNPADGKVLRDFATAEVKDKFAVLRSRRD